MVIPNVGGGKAVRNIQTGWILDTKKQEYKVGSVHIRVKPNGNYGDYISYKTADSSYSAKYGLYSTHTNDTNFYYKVPIRGFKNINKIEIQIDAPAVTKQIDLFEFTSLSINKDVRSAIVNFDYNAYLKVYEYSLISNKDKYHYYISDDLSALVFCLPFSFGVNASGTYDPPFEIKVKPDKKDLLVSNDNEIYYDMYTDFGNSYPFHYTIIEYY